jgi:3-hydroxybutyryl-CoA dehydrogenase
MIEVPQGKELIAVIGAGTMGAGIAQVVASAGHVAIIYDAQAGAFDRAMESISSGLDQRVERGRLTDADRDSTLSRIRRADSLDDVAVAHIVIEAIAEDLKMKQELFAALQGHCPPETVFATNTSSLSITELASVLSDPARLVGLHFFNPAPAMKLVEVVSGRSTAPEIARDLGHLVSGWGKHCVHARSTPGFIVNRVARPFYAEALRLLQEQVVAPATLDAIMRECGGFKMGPLELMDLIGHDINYAVTNSIYNAFFQDPRFKPSLIQKDLIDAGYLGRKSGRGFYDYSGSARPETPQHLDPQQPPQKVIVRGELGVASALRTLISKAGVAVEQVGGEGCIEFDGITLTMTDGRTATERSASGNTSEMVLYDLAIDYTTCERVVLTRADQSRLGSLERAAGLFQAIGKTVSIIDDAPGMVVMRTVCMLANEGADAVNQGVCDVKAVDKAMRYGTGYPMGPLVWADRIGIRYIVKTLKNLQLSYGEERYRISPLLQRKSHAGLDFYA